MELVARIHLYLRQERTTAQRGSFSPTKMVIVSLFYYNYYYHDSFHFKSFSFNV